MSKRKVRKYEKELAAREEAERRLAEKKAKKEERERRNQESREAWQQMSPKQKQNTYVGLGIAAVIVVLVLALLGSCGSGDDKSESSGVSDSSTTAVKETAEKVRKPGGATFTETGDGVVATFEVQDSFTKGTRISGAQMDTVDILEYAKANYPSAASVTVIGTFPLTDRYGNTEDDAVLDLLYTRDTLDRINFAGIQANRIWDLADRAIIHPDMQ